MGLFSSGSVHAYAEHVSALLELAKQNGLQKVLFAYFYRRPRRVLSTKPPNLSKEFEKELQEQYPMAKIASLIGRHYAMDRDGNWDLIEKTYRLLTEGKGKRFRDAVFVHRRTI